MAVTYKQKGGKTVPADIVKIFEDAAKEFSVPVGILLGTCECESNFRMGLVSSTGAVGVMQLRKKFAQDFYKYAGFEFDLESWEAVRGTAALYAYYAKRSKLESPNKWQYAMCEFRWGRNAVQMRNYATCKRVKDVEAHMKRNGMWYDDIPESKDGDANGRDFRQVAQKSADWAVDKVGCRYSQAERLKEGVFDCSSLVARSYEAQGVSFEGGGLPKYPTSNLEVYSDHFELLWPSTYALIGSRFGGSKEINLAKQAGDIQYICTNGSTSRPNKITHVVLIADKDTIVHARGTKFGVVLSDIYLYSGKICAVARYNPDAPLRKGMRGKRVEALQKSLIAKGAKIKADGQYGSATEKAVKEYGD